MKKYGIIGYPLAHSLSVSYFKRKFSREGIKDAIYSAYELKNIEDLPALIASERDILGLNITIPFKKSVIGYLDEIDPLAGSIGAVNTIKINRKGDTISLSGYNTDAAGFELSLKKVIKPYVSGALVLGTGGASNAVCYVLDKFGIVYRLVSRNPLKPGMLHAGDIDKKVIDRYDLIINTTPVGMYPDTDQCIDLPYQHLTSKHILYDLIYNPEETLFMKKGREAGAKAYNGLEMFRIQAERSWEIWNG